MTNFNSATKSFTLHAEGTESYSWAWEGVDRSASLKHIAEDGNDITAYAHGWACQLCNSCIDQINEDGERGFTAEEIEADLHDDRHALAAALQDWLSEGDDDGDDQEPEGPAEQGLLLCLGSLGGRGITPASAIYAFSSYQDFVDQNPQWSSVQLPQPRWHGIIIVDNIDLPVEGGYQIEWGGNPTRSGGYTYYP